MTASQLRLLFAGTPEFAAKHLAALIDHGYSIVAVYTQPDRPSGRGQQLRGSPVKQLAVAQGIAAIEQPVNFRDTDALERLASYQADVMIVVAYGLLLPPAVLQIPRLGCINIHASLLPRWRGAAPIQRAIEAGDTLTGISLMQMDTGLDTGPVLAATEVAIEDQDTSGSLSAKLATAGITTLLEQLDSIASGTLNPQYQQDHLATYAKKVDKAEARLRWHQSALVLVQKIRAFNPTPGCFSQIGDLRVKIWSAQAVSAPLNQNRSTRAGTVLQVDPSGITVACGEQALKITRLQLPGKKAISVSELLNAQPKLIQPHYLFAST